LEKEASKDNMRQERGERMPIYKKEAAPNKKRRRVLRAFLALVILCAGVWGIAALADSMDSAQLSVPYITQEGLLPTGCETVSAMMALSFLGVDASAQDILSHMVIGELKPKGGGYTAPSPDEAFIGDPYSESGYGCYPPVIVRALEDLVSEGMRPADTTGLSLKQLAREYVKNGTPVLVWATVDMQPTAEGTQWLVPSTGELFTWPRGEHCLLLTGYDRFYYYFNDPYENRGRIAYPKEQVNARFTELGSKSAAIIKK